jgi:release factor glutamine methyltransferase
MPEELWTILKLLHWTTDYFKRNNVAEPRASAETLLAHALSKDRLFLYLNYDRPLDADELNSFRTSIKRRLTGEPNQYITRMQEFWSLPFRVNPHVLIPRPETEMLVEAALDFLKPAEPSVKIMDVGTGSGAIAVALARELPEASIVATDLSVSALQLAQHNARLNKVEQKIQFVCGDIFAPISSNAQSFALVVSNPPYVSRADLHTLPREIRDFEPHYALDGGPDGLAAIKCLIKESPTILRSQGGLIMEIGADQTERVTELVLASKQYQDHRIIKDYSDMDRVLVATKG